MIMTQTIPSSDCSALSDSGQGMWRCRRRRSKSRGRIVHRKDFKQYPLENFNTVVALRNFDVLHGKLRFIPFKARDIGDIGRYKKEMRELGLWEFANLEFDGKLRADVIAKVVANYRNSNMCSGFDGFVIRVTKVVVARALRLRCWKKKVGTSVRFSKRFLGFLLEFVESYMVLKGVDWFKPEMVVEWIGMIEKGKPEKVDWAGLILCMMEKELEQGEELKVCYYASHLQELVRLQKPELLEGDGESEGEGVEVLEVEEWQQKVDEANDLVRLRRGSVGEGGEGVEVLESEKWLWNVEKQNVVLGLEQDSEGEDGEVVKVLECGEWQPRVEEHNVVHGLGQGSVCEGGVDVKMLELFGPEVGEEGSEEVTLGKDGSAEMENFGVADKEEKCGDDGKVETIGDADEQDEFDHGHDEERVHRTSKDENVVCNVDLKEMEADEVEVEVVAVQEDVHETESIEGVFSRGADSEVCRVVDVKGFELVDDVDMDCSDDIVDNAMNVDCRAMEIDNNIAMVKEDSKDAEIVNDVEQVGQRAFGRKNKNQHVLRPCSMANGNVSVKNRRLDVAQSIEGLNGAEDKFPHAQPLDGMSFANQMQAFPTGQLSYSTLDLGDSTLIDRSPTDGSFMKDRNSFSDHGTCKEDNYPEQGFSEPVLNGLQNGLRSNGRCGDIQSEFDVKVDKIVHLLGELKMMNRHSIESPIQQVNMIQQTLTRQLADKEAENLHLRGQIDTLQWKNQAEKELLNRELYLMKDAIDGYRKTLIATHTKFCDFRKQMGVRERPICRDAGSGGVVKTAAELESDSRLKQEQEKELMFSRFQKVCNDYIVEFDSKQTELLAKVQSMDDRLQNAGQKVALLIHQLKTSTGFQAHQISSEDEVSD